MMKYFALFSRVLVGVEFIVSGFMKVIDPYGTGLKLQEYFEVFAGDLPKLAPFFNFFSENALVFALLICSLELILGVALLFSFKMKTSAWVVLGFMVFFTFLTFYSAYFNKVTDCGCFGDFLKLKPWHSFYKDVVSMVFITIIFLYRNKYKKSDFGTPLVLIATLFSFGIGIYGIRYLPIIDILAYAKGKSIPEQMKKPDIKPIYKYQFLDKKTNKNIESAEYLMDTLKYKYVSAEILNQDALMPKITDFSLSDNLGNDVTNIAFDGNKLLIVLKKREDLEQTDISGLVSVANKISRKNISPIILTSMPNADFDFIKKSKNLKFDAYTSDEKVLKTMARTNPCLILVKDGVVMGKWSNNDLPTVDELTELVAIKK